MAQAAPNRLFGAAFFVQLLNSIGHRLALDSDVYLDKG
ncbi:hypothetical protein Dret_1365 [Desulfohalobium retbaense DSM 5692]|uniref:Uncharacterized protein n=1 Tax=Desulfohalobium retbaense (strain ATCC 49708 / DSM 5692 / JCM 16813 / HR100) TaxID=485915 RepID=C8X2K6_DESRD|nr:hypothetical protein Dret_1365 [Desulfohalobium retbaense DSM 5692]